MGTDSTFCPSAYIFILKVNTRQKRPPDRNFLAAQDVSVQAYASQAKQVRMNVNCRVIQVGVLVSILSLQTFRVTYQKLPLSSSLSSYMHVSEDYKDTKPTAILTAL